VLFGPTRYYKTVWARSLGQHSYLGGNWNATNLDVNKTYVIVDDIPLDNPDMFRHYKQILGCQREFSVTDKYVKKLHIKNWAKPCIYIANQDPREYTGVDIAWLDGNCVFVEVTKPLFVEATPDLELLISSLDVDSDNSF
jgi:hypothetical protein